MKGGNKYNPYIVDDDGHGENKRLPILKRFAFTGLLIKLSGNVMEESFEYTERKHSLLPQNMLFGILSILSWLFSKNKRLRKNF